MKTQSSNPFGFSVLFPPGALPPLSSFDYPGDLLPTTWAGPPLLRGCVRWVHLRQLTSRRPPPFISFRLTNFTPCGRRCHLVFSDTHDYMNRVGAAGRVGGGRALCYNQEVQNKDKNRFFVLLFGKEVD